MMRRRCLHKVNDTFYSKWLLFFYKMNVKAGVPQDSISGSVYINAFDNNVSDSDLYLYTSGTQILKKAIATIPQSLNQS